MLETIREPRDIKSLSIEQLEALAHEIREEIIGVVAENGGHLASNLGMVELTLALHCVFDCPEDKLIFDVGHQTYTHKLLTGRQKQFRQLRQRGGASGFTNMQESEYDAFTAGHASTAISAALGMARTRDIMHGDNHVVAVLGDGTLTGGMCYEALNDAGQSKTKLIVVLNDNAMSISRNVGAMSYYLSDLRQSRPYRSFKRGVRSLLERIPHAGTPALHFVEKIRDGLKTLLLDGQFFEAMGFEYTGPVDGHDIKRLIRILERAKRAEGPVLLHVVTQKGKGYRPAENRPDTFHGVAPFFVESGALRKDAQPGFGSVLGEELIAMAETDIRICAITAAMPQGTGLSAFAERFPERFFDVGIAEEHALTMAAGMASEGMRPYVCVYSTFLQRAFDQVMTDICIHSLPVSIMIDRAGLVGADGVTHQGLFDLSYLRLIPNLVIAAPRDVRDLKKLIALSRRLNGPIAIRYPKQADDMGPWIQTHQDFGTGEWELLADGADIMFLAVGSMVQTALQASIELVGKGISAGAMDARFVKPLDEGKLLEAASRVKLLVTLEENVLAGGFGDAVADCLNRHGCAVRLRKFGVPDRFIAHGTIDEQRQACGLDVYSIVDAVLKELNGGQA